MIDFEPADLADKAAMRALAHEITKRAQRIREAAVDATVAVNHVDFDGPYATQCRGSIHEARMSSFRTALQLDSVARDLLATVARVESEESRIDAKNRATAERLQREQLARLRGAT